eukprot:2657896-Rhodomonas_salina.1
MGPGLREELMVRSHTSASTRAARAWPRAFPPRTKAPAAPISTKRTPTSAESMPTSAERTSFLFE